MLRFVVCCYVLILCGCAAKWPPITELDDNSQLMEAKNGSFQRWSYLDFPIFVVVEATMNREYQEAVEEAVVAWNHILDRKVFIVQEYTIHRAELDEPTRRTVTVREAELGLNEYKVRLYGSARNSFARGGRITRSRISLDPGIPTEAQLPVAIHELGHALGLRHDEDSPESIMFPSIHDAFCQNIQAEDVETIRQQMLF